MKNRAGILCAQLKSEAGKWKCFGGKPEPRCNTDNENHTLRGEIPGGKSASGKEKTFAENETGLTNENQAATKRDSWT
jgi:hypothetical protein